MKLTTITSREFCRLNEARQLQIERYRTAYFKREGELPKDDDPAISRHWLRVLINGQDRCIPVKLLTAWAKTFDTDTPLTFNLAPNGVLVVKRGTSSLKLFTAAPMYDDKGRAWLTAADSTVRGFPAELPDAIPLIADNGTIRLDLPDVTAELAALARETTSNRKTVAHEKALAKARKAEKTTLDALNRHTEEATAAQAVIDKQTLAEAVAFARRCLAARRVFRASLDALDTLPGWLPATYQDEVYVPSTETEEGQFKPCTVDAAAEWRELVAVYQSARAAREAYKPRQGGRVARWRPSRHKRPATKLDRLIEAETKARDTLTQFLSARYREHLATLGLPDSLASDDKFGAWSVLSGCQIYTRARQLLRTWPQRRDDLQSAYNEAVAKREGLEESD
jgi:hypothetical protein